MCARLQLKALDLPLHSLQRVDQLRDQSTRQFKMVVVVVTVSRGKKFRSPLSTSSRAGCEAESIVNTFSDMVVTVLVWKSRLCNRHPQPHLRDVYFEVCVIRITGDRRSSCHTLRTVGRCAEQQPCSRAASSLRLAIQRDILLYVLDQAELAETEQFDVSRHLAVIEDTLLQLLADNLPR